MRIACVDQDPRTRRNLKSFVDELFESCRDAVGHIVIADTYGTSKEELLVNSAPDLAIFKPLEDQIDETLFVMRDVNSALPAVPLIVFLESNLYNYRNLKRFDSYAVEIFSTKDNPLQIIHKLANFKTKAVSSPAGQLIPIIGTKGGIGSTSITAALAHASQSLGKTAVVVDLSPLASLLHYLATPRWSSSEYAALLTENRHPDSNTIEHLLTTAPNRITALLPPAGSVDIRDYWLRDSNRFELTLAIIEELQQRYDLVLVDTANVEGILPYALISRSNTTLIVSSNDPAAVHLLNSRLTQIAEIPGAFSVKLLFNMLLRQGLSREDIIDFLYVNTHFQESMCSLPHLSFDPRGSRWMGTTNTFYTESSTKTQLLLERILVALCGYQSTVTEDTGKAWLPKLLGYNPNRSARHPFHQGPHSTPTAIPYFGALKPTEGQNVISPLIDQRSRASLLSPISLNSTATSSDKETALQQTELFELPRATGGLK